LPDTDLFIDIRSRLHPDIEVIPEPVTARAPLEIRVKLLARIEGKDRVVPIKRADVFIVGREPEDIQGISYKLRDIKYVRGVAVSRLTEGVPAAGKYIFKMKPYFQPSPESKEPVPIYFTHLITVRSPLPLEGNVWIARRRAKPEREKDLRVVLPPIGERFRISYEAVEIRTNLTQIIDGLKVVLPPLRHTDTGVELKSINRNWAKVLPPTVRGLTLGRPVPLRIEVAIPSQIPPDIPDGTYQSVLEIRDGTRVLDSVPVSIGVSIPRFVFTKEEINKPFYPEAEASLPLVKRTIYYPGALPHSLKVRLWSTSLLGTEASAYFVDARGLRYSQGGQAEERTEYVLYNVAKERFRIPGKNEKGPGTIEAQVRLLDPSLNGMTFSNILYVTGKQHREAPVKLVVKIAFLPRRYLRLGYLLLFLCGLYLLYRWFTLIRLRGLFEGREITRPIQEGEPSDYEIRFRGRLIGRFSYNGRPLPSSTISPFGTLENKVISFEAENAYFRRDELRETLPQPYFPQEGDEIIIGSRRRRFVIRMEKLPSMDDPSYTYTIQRSPLGSGKIGYLYLFLCMPLLIISVVGLTRPYLVLQMIRL
jgi:hypothetical protein